MSNHYEGPNTFGTSPLLFICAIRRGARNTLPWDTSCLSKPDVVVFQDVPTRTLKMLIDKQQRLRLGTKSVVTAIGYCQDTNSTTETIQ
jgi:hypothetical protein